MNGTQKLGKATEKPPDNFGKVEQNEDLSSIV